MVTKKKSYAYLFVILAVLMFDVSCGEKSDYEALEKGLKVQFAGDAKIEVGGPYVGIEMHHSSVLPQRISFFHPVANSIDASTDYWKRDSAFVMALGLKIGDGPKEWLGYRPTPFDLTPYSVKFQKGGPEKSVNISYRFCESRPAMVVTYEITNAGSTSQVFEFETHLETDLRTCHTYRKVDKAWTEFDGQGSTIYVNYDDPETQNAQVFVANAGEQPVDYNSVGALNRSSLEKNDFWKDAPVRGEKLVPREKQAVTSARFLYKKELAPSQKMTVVQIIGSARQNEGRGIVAYLLKNYKDEIARYEEKVLNKAGRESALETGDSAIDHSARWAKAILAANAHYLYGRLVPMPCPAEYNFYFTHDVLMTDLAAVNFDLQRVKNDLQYIIDHANAEKIIPHAYYWKDSTYVTEYATSDNWNNFWFIIVSASYLRHSADTAFVKILYPYLAKSLHQALLTKGEDDLMYSYRPDWWDIGKNYGPRTYMTTLAIKSIRDLLYLSNRIGENQDRLAELENLADRMQAQLVSRLWDANLNFLVNYFEDGSMDDHYYIGSLLAAHFNMLETDKVSALVESAKRHLLDEKLGIYVVYPMDYERLQDYLKFVGNEAGEQFYYMNGGIWPHGNAWYALALMSDNRREEALGFIKKTMTLEGIMSGPNGQPAMYEVRNANFHDPSVYGTVDKPQFLWAGAWYLYSLYHLFGIRENSWNIGFSPFLAAQQKSAEFDLCANGQVLRMGVAGSGEHIKDIRFDGKKSCSAVIPAGLKNIKNVDIILGSPETAYLDETNSSLNSCTYDKDSRSLKMELAAFPGHHNTTRVVSPIAPEHVYLNHQELKDGWQARNEGGLFRVEVNFLHIKSVDKLEFKFDNTSLKGGG